MREVASPSLQAVPYTHHHHYYADDGQQS